MISLAIIGSILLFVLTCYMAVRFDKWRAKQQDPIRPDYFQDITIPRDYELYPKPIRQIRKQA